VRVVERLESILREQPRRAETRQQIAKEVAYLKEHQHRMDYREGQRRVEPIGSGAIEATCRQDQCRFKRPGQFWSPHGDEALLCLETFWRNNRWQHLFPHLSSDLLSKN